MKSENNAHHTTFKILVFIFIVISLVFNAYLYMQVNTIRNLMFSSELDRRADGYPAINFGVLNESKFHECADRLEDSYTNEVYGEGNLLTPALRLFLNSDISYSKLSYELKQVDGITLNSIDEDRGFIDVMISQQNKIEQYAYWACFFEMQEFVSDWNYGVGTQGYDGGFFIE